MRIVFSSLALAAALTACGPEPTPTVDVDAPPPSAQPSPAPVPAPWTFGRSAAGGATLSHDAGSTAEVRIACQRNPDQLLVFAAGLEPIGSEDRLTIGAGGVAHALVADLSLPGPGVTASGSMEPALLDALEAGQPIGLSYGAQQITLGSPGADLARGFAAACRAAP